MGRGVEGVGGGSGARDAEVGAVVALGVPLGVAEGLTLTVGEGVGVELDPDGVDVGIADCAGRGNVTS